MGLQRAALTGTIATYQIPGRDQDLGKALSLPPERVDQLSKQTDHYGSSRHVEKQMQKSEHFQEK